MTGQPIPDPNGGVPAARGAAGAHVPWMREALRELAGVTPGGPLRERGHRQLRPGRPLHAAHRGARTGNCWRRTEREVFQERFPAVPGRRAGAAGAGVPAARSDPAPPAARKARGRERGVARPPAAAALLIALAAACAAPTAARALGVPEQAERDGRLAFADGRFGDCRGRIRLQRRRLGRGWPSCSTTAASPPYRAGRPGRARGWGCCGRRSSRPVARSSRLPATSRWATPACGAVGAGGWRRRVPRRPIRRRPSTA